MLYKFILFNFTYILFCMSVRKSLKEVNLLMQFFFAFFFLFVLN